MSKAYGSLTVVDLVDSATYIYYAKDSQGTNTSITPSNETKYIGFYSGPPISGGQPNPGTSDFNKIKGQIQWHQANGKDGITPIQLIISSQNGTVFVNGIPNITLQARVFQDGVDITDNYLDSSFHWFKIQDIEGSVDLGTKEKIGEGKTFVVQKTSIGDKANFICTLTIPNEDERLKQLPLWNGGNF